MLRSRVLKLRQTCFGSRAQQLFFFFGKKSKKRQRAKTSSAPVAPPSAPGEVFFFACFWLSACGAKFAT